MRKVCDWPSHDGERGRLTTEVCVAVYERRIGRLFAEVKMGWDSTTRASKLALMAVVRWRGSGDAFARAPRSDWCNPPLTALIFSCTLERPSTSTLLVSITHSPLHISPVTAKYGLPSALRPCAKGDRASRRREGTNDCQTEERHPVTLVIRRREDDCYHHLSCSIDCDTKQC